MIEIYGQESSIKGLRIVKFEVDPKNNDHLFWIDVDGSRSFKYGRKELEMNGWIRLD